MRRSVRKGAGGLLLRRAGWAGLLLAALGGCADLPPAAPPGRDAPVLRLAPQALGRPLSLQQQLSVTAGEQTHRIEVLLEADPAAVRLALVSLGQTAARLEWDGQALKETRASWLPAVVSSERILSDLQLVLWPADAIRAVLPAGWTLAADPQERVLAQHGEAVVRIRYPSPTRAELSQLREAYSLRVDSRDLSGGAP